MFSTDQYSRFADAYDGIVEDDGGLLARYIINPCIFSLLGDIHDRSVVDICCGQGYLTCALARRGAKVVGVDISTQLLALAKQRSIGTALAVDYVRADVTQPLPLACRFHVAICTLSLMDIYDYHAAIQNVSAVLLDGAQFIISLMHPLHFHDEDYFDTEACRLHVGLAQHGVTVYYWHRPLEDYVCSLSAAGFCIKQLREPRPSLAAITRYPAELTGRGRQPSFVVIEAVRHGV